jgi:hypothetical protein
MKFEVLTVVMSMLFFWVAMPCGPVSGDQRFGDGDSMFLHNVGTYLQVHTASQPRRPTSTNKQNDR